MAITVSVITARTVSLCLEIEPDACYHLQQPRSWALSARGETVQKGTADRPILFIDGLEPATRYEFELDGHPSYQLETCPCTGLVDIRDHGARLDANDNAPSINKAIQAVPVGGTLYIPPGLWQAAPLFLKSSMTLLLDADATLQLIKDRQAIPILPARNEHGKMLGSWEGLPAACYASLINGIDCHTLSISGQGTLDGGGQLGDWWQWPKETRDGARRGRTLFLRGCKDASLSGITVQNSPSWTVHPLYCENLIASAISILNPPNSPNTDGFNPESCHSVTMEGIHFTVGDDCIAIKAGKRGTEPNDHLMPCRNISIRHCLMERGHGAVVIGSEMSGTVENVLISQCEFVGTDRGLRIKTRRGRGGKVAGIRMQHCKMNQVETAFVANSYYFCDDDGCSEWVQSRKPYPVDASTPQISDITVNDVAIDNIKIAIGAFYGLPEAPIRTVTFDNISASFDDSEEGDIPVMALQIPVCHHAQFLSEHAEMKIGNVRLTSRKSEETKQAAQC